MSNPNLTGERYGRLTVIEKSSAKGAYRGQRWLCRCDCGRYKTTTTNRLRMGGAASCGCYAKERYAAGGKSNTRHGHSANGEESLEYVVWKSMKTRCNNPNCESYPKYGGRGIKICDRWSDYAVFLADMGPRPSSDYSLDRIDNNGNYEPSNCRWATSKEQAANKRNSIHITHEGQTLLLSEWAKLKGIDFGTIRYRLKIGWSVADALDTPPTNRNRKGKRLTLST